jgi:NifB/MoaA-like Fe-S oxidoreductase
MLHAAEVQNQILVCPDYNMILPLYETAFDLEDQAVYEFRYFEIHSSG